MKKLVIILVLLVLGGNCFGQENKNSQDSLETRNIKTLKRPLPKVCGTPTELTTIDIEREELIAAIKNIVGQINNDTNYILKTLNNEQFLPEMTDGGGHLTGYFKNGELVKIIEWIGLSSCVNKTEYYLKDGDLIFAFTQGEEFEYIDSTASFSYNSQSIVMECRFYYDNNKEIKSIIKGATRCSGKLTIDWVKNYLAESILYSKLLK